MPTCLKVFVTPNQYSENSPQMFLDLVRAAKHWRHLVCTFPARLNRKCSAFLLLLWCLSYRGDWGWMWQGPYSVMWETPALGPMSWSLKPNFDSHCRRPRFDPWSRNIPWRREWLCTLAFLPEEFHGQRSLAGYSSESSKELDMTERLTFSFSFTSSGNYYWGNLWQASYLLLNPVCYFCRMKKPVIYWVYGLDKSLFLPKYSRIQ